MQHMEFIALLLNKHIAQSAPFSNAHEFRFIFI